MSSGWNEVLLLSFNFVLHLAKSSCSSFQFQCNNGIFIGNEQICNFKDDCGDNSDESRSYGVLCGMLNYAFCNNDINSYERSHVADLEFQILTSLERCHPLNLLISKPSSLKCLCQLFMKSVILKQRSLINLKFSKALFSSIEAHQCKSQVIFLIAFSR